jgi:hypothetical protein
MDNSSTKYNLVRCPRASPKHQPFPPNSADLTIVTVYFVATIIHLDTRRLSSNSCAQQERRALRSGTKALYARRDLSFNNLMDYLQLLFSLFTAPLLATVLLGMFTTWATPEAGFWALLFGTLSSIAHNFAYRTHWITYGSDMSANFYGAIVAWASCFLVTALLSVFTPAKSLEELADLTCWTATHPRHSDTQDRTVSRTRSHRQLPVPEHSLPLSPVNMLGLNNRNETSTDRFRLQNEGP